MMDIDKYERGHQVSENDYVGDLADNRRPGDWEYMIPNGPVIAGEVEDD